jgi:hypothetical protein
MGASATLQSFIEWSIANYPAKHYALVLWNHGSGWRGENSSAIKSICVDDQANDELTMTELRSALNAANGTTGEVLDIIGFDACLMQMVEVAYQVMGSASRSLADITVGSEETEPGDGWDYAATLTALTANPTMTASGLATRIVNDYMNFYGTTTSVTQSAANLGLVDELATAISSFAQAMTSATGDWDKIRTARGQAQEYYYVYYIDLYHFAQLVNQNTSISQTVRNAASSVMTAVNNAIIAEGHSTSLAGSHGLSIYYPETLAYYFSDYETSVLFTTDTQWDEFLNAILSPDTTPPTVTSTSPASGTTGVAVNTAVTATFSEAMNASTITTSSFTLGGVSGSVSYNSGTNTATFTPSANLAYSTTYTATLSTAITDAVGNPLASAYSWNFTTASAPAGVTVSIDAPAQAAPNSDFTANVNISQVVNFDACNYDVSFDASVLRLENVTSGLIGSTTIPVDVYNQISPGTYRVIQNVPGLTGVSGSGYLAVLHFHVIGSGGSSPISLSNGMLANNLAQEIAATWVGDSVNITSVLPGDANGDGNVNALDITKVERIIAGLDAETPGADANGDGNVNALDITKIELKIAGLG